MVQFLAKANEDPVNDDDDIEKKPLGNSRDRSTNATAVNTANNSTVELKLADPQERNVELKGQDSLQIVELPSVPEVSSTASGVEPTPKAETRTKIWTKRIIVGVWEITTPALVAAIVSLVIVGAKPVQVRHTRVIVVRLAQIPLDFLERSAQGEMAYYSDHPTRSSLHSSE